MINSETRLYALMGDPVEHSLSPLMHNTAFQFFGLNCVYLAMRVKAEALRRAVEGVKSLGIWGLNVTIPHKVSIIKYLDEIDPMALSISAVNTVVNKDGRLIGYNTDGAGALAALKEKRVDPADKKVVVLGAGGAARAASFYLAPLAEKLVILNRTRSKATSLATEISERFKCDVVGEGLRKDSLSRELTDADILINATPVGMYPNVNETLVDRHLIDPRMTVFDMVYNPLDTQLLKEARAAGAKGLGGIMMLLYQGILCFEVWFGKRPPIDLLLKEMKKGLKEKVRW